MEIRQAIEEINARFLDAYHRGDAAALSTGYTEDCAVLVPNQPTVLGRQGVETLFTEIIEELGGTVTLEIVEVAEAGDIAYQWAAYTLESGDMSDVGQIVEVFNRQADGSWKIHRSIFNSDKP